MFKLLQIPAEPADSLNQIQAEIAAIEEQEYGKSQESRPIGREK